MSDLFWTTSSFESNLVPSWVSESYQAVLPYVEEFLCAQHPFRQGVMCPFVPKALRNERIFFIAGIPESLEDSVDLVQKCVRFFKLEKKSAADYVSVIILFPPSFSSSQLLEIHRNARVKCMENSLMLGALYPTSQAPSLHNDAYFPLRTPVPTLVIRDIVANDLVFLDTSVDNPKNKIIFLNTFLRLFASKTDANTVEKCRKASKLLLRYQKLRVVEIVIKSFLLISTVTLATYLVLYETPL